MDFSLLIISEIMQRQCCYQTEIESKLIAPDNLAWHIVFSRIYLTTDAGRMVSIENRQGEGKNNIGNVEAKELICMTHGHELKGGNGGGRGCAGQRGIEGGKWDN